MKVYAYPADQYGCGHHRMVWPCEELARQGHDVTVIPQERRALSFTIDSTTNQVTDVELPSDVDVVIFQRVTHVYVAQAISLIRRRGVSVVVDVDDDLTNIHPGNPAFDTLHPKNFGRMKKDGERHLHSWNILQQACRDASLVTLSTTALTSRYARHGRYAVVNNYLARHYYDVPEREPDVDVLWPASLHSHPNDPETVGFAIGRVVDDGYSFETFGEPEPTANAFGLSSPTHGWPDPVTLEKWPHELARARVGIAPLANTKFNQSKSMLKPLELSAVGVPWIGSPRDEYVRLKVSGSGLLAKKPHDWYRKMTMLLQDDILRRELGEQGRYVARQFILSDHAWRWWQAWELARDYDRV